MPVLHLTNTDSEGFVDRLLGSKSRETKMCSECKEKPSQEVLFGDLAAFENPHGLCIDCLMKEVTSRSLSQVEIERAAEQSISSRNHFISVPTFLTEEQRCLIKEKALELLEERQKAREKAEQEDLLASVDKLLEEAGFGFVEVSQLDKKYKNLLGILMREINKKQDKSFSGVFG